MPHHFYTSAASAVPALALLVTTLASTLIQALNAHHDALADLCLPCLINIAPHVHSMDAVTAECLVALLVQLIQRLQRLECAWLRLSRLSRCPLHRSCECECGARAGLSAHHTGSLCAGKRDATLHDMHRTKSHRSRPRRSRHRIIDITFDPRAESVPASHAQEEDKTPQSAAVTSPPSAWAGHVAADMQTAHAAACEGTLRQLAGVVEALETMLRDAARDNDALILMLVYAKDYLASALDESVQTARVTTTPHLVPGLYTHASQHRGAMSTEMDEEDEESEEHETEDKACSSPCAFAETMAHMSCHVSGVTEGIGAMLHRRVKSSTISNTVSTKKSSNQVSKSSTRWATRGVVTLTHSTICVHALPLGRST